MTVDTTEIYEAVPDTELIENSEVLNVNCPLCQGHFELV